MDLKKWENRFWEIFVTQALQNFQKFQTQAL